MADKQITNPAGAFGVTDLNQKGWRLEAPMKASAAVTAKRVVSLGTDGTVAITATNGTALLQVGIAVDAIASGSVGEVIVAGFASGVPATGAISAGDPVKRSTTTSGSVSVAATTSGVVGEVIGVAIANSASNLVDIWVWHNTAAIS